MVCRFYRWLGGGCSSVIDRKEKGEGTEESGDGQRGGRAVEGTSLSGRLGLRRNRNSAAVGCRDCREGGGGSLGVYAGLVPVVLRMCK